MSHFNPDELKQQRENLLMAELAALLHDVGKFCNLHIEAHSLGGKRQWSNDHAYKVIVDHPEHVIRLSKAAANIKKPDALNNVLNASSPKASDFLSDDAKDALEKTTVSFFDQRYTLAELMMLGTPGFATDQNRSQLLDSKDGWFPAVLGVCHNEAHHDKQEPGKSEGQQNWPWVWISTAFGYEKECVTVDSSLQSLDERLKHLPINLHTFNAPYALANTLASEFMFGLGDTRRPINEVTLADWATPVAALFKSALASALCQSTPRDIRRWLNWQQKIIDHDLCWRMLRVNFDVLGLYAKAIKIADLFGYQESIEKACVAVKQLVEEEYPLGNEVYRDTTGVYFTFPDLDLPDELREKIREKVEDIEPELAPRINVGNPHAGAQLRLLLIEQRMGAGTELAQPFTTDTLSPHWEAEWGRANRSGGRWEVCPVCRLRPMEEGEDTCEHCHKRRGSRIEVWKKNPSKTVWMDELADHNGRVALIVSRFGLGDWLSGDMVQTMLVHARENDPAECTPKNPSPARLRRVWETCQRFWTEPVEDIVRGVANQMPELRRARMFVTPDKKGMWKENVPYDGTISGVPISLLWQGAEKQFVTAINLELAAGDAKEPQELAQKWQGREITVGDPENPRQRLPFKVEGACSATNDWGQYLPYLTLLTSPDQFLALAPAGDALEIAERIRQEYVKQFGKVQNRLPLFLGLIFFQRKTPLMAVMDTARRMLEVSLEEDTEPWQVKDIRDDWAIVEKDGYSWDIPTKMGDSATEDVWYPYFFVDSNDEPTHASLRFRLDQGKYAGRWLAHVRCLRKGDRVRVMPSRFTYFFLEHTAKRFEFDPGKNVRHLEELPKLMEMWQAICNTRDMTDTKLRGVADLLQVKGELWGSASPELRHLAETTLKEAKLWNPGRNDSAVSADDVSTGRFAYCLELYLHILKRRAKTEKQHEQQPATV